MQLETISLNKKKSATLEVADAVFACPFKEDLVHQVVVAYMAYARAGTRAQKTRAEVRGGGRKPWKQKGSGRARAGTIRSPLWRKGGITFAAKPQDYSQKVNRKMYRGAMASILSELVRQQRLIVVDEFKLSDRKTKGLLAQLKPLNLDHALIVTSEVDHNLYYASRNLFNIEVADPVAVSPVNLIHYEKVLITSDALKQLEGKLA